jgi:hypothetical protein
MYAKYTRDILYDPFSFVYSEKISGDTLPSGYVTFFGEGSKFKYEEGYVFNGQKCCIWIATAEEANDWSEEHIEVNTV